MKSVNRSPGVGDSSNLDGDATTDAHSTTLDAGIATLSVSVAAVTNPHELAASGSAPASPSRSAGKARHIVGAGASCIEGDEREVDASLLPETKRHNRLRLQRLSLPDSSPTRSEVPPTPLAMRREGVLPRSLPVDSIPIVVARTPSPEQTRRVLAEGTGSGDTCGLGLAVSVAPDNTSDSADDRPDLSYFPALATARSPRLSTINMDAPSSPASTAPPSPHVMRSSAFGADLLRPRTPLSPSHVPGAPALGANGHGFEWPAFSPPATPTSPVIRAALGEAV